MMSGIQFQIFLRWAAPQLGFTFLWMKKSNDTGGDLCLKNFNNETIIVQAKQRQEAIDKKAVYEAHAAQDHYHTDKAVIIITSRFTRPAIELANEFHIELWDWNRLCLELRNHDIYYPLE
jgi:HJR/Mrr/RecB family endonuclease